MTYVVRHTCGCGCFFSKEIVFSHKLKGASLFASKEEALEGLKSKGYGHEGDPYWEVLEVTWAIKVHVEDDPEDWFTGKRGFEHLFSEKRSEAKRYATKAEAQAEACAWGKPPTGKPVAQVVRLVRKIS